MVNSLEFAVFPPRPRDIARAFFVARDSVAIGLTRQCSFRTPPKSRFRLENSPLKALILAFLIAVAACRAGANARINGGAIRIKAKTIAPLASPARRNGAGCASPRRRAAIVFCPNPNIPSAHKASRAAGIAPAKISALSPARKPSRISSPNPPAPTKAAIVVMPMHKTVAVRIPAIIASAASGNST